MNLYFQVRGNQSNPPILFLHGFLGLGEDWLEITQNLSADHFCILPDLPGHGQSRELPNRRLPDMMNASEEIIRLLDSLGIARVTLVGYSMGGRVALYTAVTFPRRVKALVLESTNPGIEDNAERRDRAVTDDLRAAQIERNGIAMFIEQWYNTPLFETLHRQPEKLARLRQSRLAHDPSALAAALRGLSVGRQPSLWPHIVDLDIPTMIVTGQLDQKYCDIGGKTAARLPQSRHVVITDAGHNTHLEQPQEFLARVREFLHDTGVSTPTAASGRE